MYSVYSAFHFRLQPLKKTLVVFSGSLILLFLIASMVVASGTARASAPVPMTKTNWPMFGFSPQHSHFNPRETILSPKTVSGMVLNWSVNTPGYIDTTAAVVNGVVYIGSSDGTLYAFNAATGKQDLDVHDERRGAYRFLASRCEWDRLLWLGR